MNSQLLIPLVLYLAAVFGLALFTRRHHQTGKGFLNEYLVGGRSMGGLRPRNDVGCHLCQCQFVHRGDRARPIKWGWAGYCWQ